MKKLDILYKKFFQSNIYKFLAKNAQYVFLVFVVLIIVIYYFFGQEIDVVLGIAATTIAFVSFLMMSFFNIVTLLNFNEWKEDSDTIKGKVISYLLTLSFTVILVYLSYTIAKKILVPFFF